MLNRLQIAKALRRALVETPRREETPGLEPQGVVKTVTNHDVLHGLKRGRYMLVSRELVEQIVAELERKWQ